MAGIDDFKAKLTGGGARPSMFKVICNFPAFAGGNSELASFMIKGASLPSSTLGSIEVPYKGGKKLKIAGDRTYEPWTLTVINDTNMEIRNAFERWMEAISAARSGNGLSAPNSYQTDMTVQQLDKSDKVVKEYFIRGAFPTNVSSIDLNWETTDAIEEFTVELTYQYWTLQGVTK